MNLGQLTLSTLKLILTFYVAACILLYFLQDHLLFFPRSTPAANLNKLKPFEINIDLGDTMVRGWFAAGKSQTAPLIIYYGGNAEEVSHTLFDRDRLKDSSLLAVNYRGFGESEGSPVPQKLAEDAVRIFDFMVDQKGLDPKRTILMGRSIGSGIAVHVASQRRVLALVLITPIDSLLNVARGHYGIFPVKLLLRHKLDPLSLAPEIDRPVLVLMADKDTIVPTRHSQKLIRHWRGTVTQITIKGAGHNSISNRPEYWQAIGDFIGKMSETTDAKPF